MAEALDLEVQERHFLPQNFKVTDWEAIKPFLDDLKDRSFNSPEDFKQWLLDRSELESVLSEDLAWRYIRMTCDTANSKFTEEFNFFVGHIQPHVAPYTDAFNRKALESPFLNQVRSQKGYDVAVKLLEKDRRIFREQNIPLDAEQQQEQQRYGSITGAMTVEIDGKELTLQQASDYLQKNDRKKREEAWKKISQRRFSDHQELDKLFNKLVFLRNQIATNADFSNFRDFMFKALGRFAYTAEDCFSFHDAVQQEVVPVLKQLAEQRREALQAEELKPWDLNVNYFGDEALKPFSDGEDLLNKTIACFNRIDPYIASCIQTMKKMGHLDLESRKGKAPGGYNYPLDETGVPFIFMNATSSLRDLVTMVHEGGHALHSFLTRNLELLAFKHPPSEVAELASMSMELISMEHWDVFFDKEEDLKRAKREHLEDIIGTLPWVATIDKFQHWIYENPGHSATERTSAWSHIYESFSNQITDWSGLEIYKKYLWQKQLHIYEVPFYYIEYAIAQLGAIAIWRNYKADPTQGLKKYMEALALGYTKPINEIYEVAGIRFDFSRDYIRELVSFIREELKKLD